MKQLNNKKLSKGFTLIELMIVIAIAAILMTLAVPSMSLMINNSKVTSATNEFIGSLNLARSEALKRSNNVSICKSNAAFTACDTSATTFTSNGWLVFLNCNDNDVVDTTAAAAACSDGGVDTIIKVGESNDQISIREYGTTGGAGENKVTYNLSGRVTGSAPIFEVKTLSGDTSVKQNKVTISRIGRVKSERI